MRNERRCSRGGELLIESCPGALRNLWPALKHSCTFTQLCIHDGGHHNDSHPFPGVRNLIYTSVLTTSSGMLQPMQINRVPASSSHSIRLLHGRRFFPLHNKGKNIQRFALDRNKRDVRIKIMLPANKLTGLVDRLKYENQGKPKKKKNLNIVF